MPADYNEDDYLKTIDEMGGLSVPLNVFLAQEIQRLQGVISSVRKKMQTMIQAIKGEVVITSSILQGIDSIYDARVPVEWTHSAGGDEISWLSPTLGLWFASLVDRDAQSRSWLADGRPVSFWLSGFFNPQGFLTAVQQEVTRAHKAEKWSLDAVIVHTEVTEYERPEQVRSGPREGVLIHGLSLDGAAWSKAEASLIESEPKILFSPLPLLMVTAVTKSQKRAASGDHGPYGGYDAPVYKYPRRTDRYIIFEVTLSTREQQPVHWALRGVALLCETS